MPGACSTDKQQLDLRRAEPGLLRWQYMQFQLHLPVRNLQGVDSACEQRHYLRQRGAALLRRDNVLFRNGLRRGAVPVQVSLQRAVMRMGMECVLRRRSMLHWIPLQQ